MFDLKPRLPADRNPLECPQVKLQEDGRICEECLDPNDPHPLIDGKIAVQLRFIDEKYRERSLTCAYAHCPWAQQNKEQKCGEGSSRKQAGRARCQAFCMHPDCRRGFHPLCYSIVHRLMQHVSLAK